MALSNAGVKPAPVRGAGRWRLAANTRSMLLMVIAMGVFVLNDTLTKTVSGDLPTGQIIFIRNLLATLILAPFVFSRFGPAAIAAAYSKPLLIRNLSEIVAVICYLSAIFRLPIANVTAVFQLVPLAMTAAAAVYLKERVGWRRWSAAAVGLAGVVLIIRPGTADFSWWYVAVLAAVVVVTTRDIATRFIDRATPTLIVVFLTAVAVTLAGLLLLPFETWKTPEMHHLVRLAAAAMLCCAGYYALIECWRDGDVSATAPFRYSVVLWAILFGALFLGEMPTYWTLAGSAIVMGAGLYTFVRERQLANRG